MNDVDFKVQMQRLISRFGEKAYSDQFTKLLWNEISWLPKNGFEYMVDRAIGEMRQAPLLPEFREMVSAYRENQARFDKQEQKKQADEFTSSFTNEEEQYIANELKESQKIVNSSERNARLEKLMKFLNERSPSECRRCDDTGVVWNFDSNNRPISCGCKFANTQYPKTEKEYEQWKQQN